MSGYDDTDLPFYYWLAKSFAIDDRHFAPMATGTYANRAFFMLGTNAGVIDTGIDYPSPSTPSIFQLLINAGYTWAAYTDGAPFDGSLDWGVGTPGVHPLTDALRRVRRGHVAERRVRRRDRGHRGRSPGSPTCRHGEVWTKKIYDHAVASPEWPRTAILWTYDEAAWYATPTVTELLGLVFSPWTEKARFALDVRRVPYTFRHYQPLIGEPALRVKLRRLTGSVTVPVLTLDDGRVLADSADIARWADGRGEGPRLFPPEHEAAIVSFVALSERALAAGRALSLPRMLANDEALAEMVPRPIRRALGPFAARIGGLGVARTLRKYNGDLHTGRRTGAPWSPPWTRSAPRSPRRLPERRRRFWAASRLTNPLAHAIVSMSAGPRAEARPGPPAEVRRPRAGALRADARDEWRGGAAPARTGAGDHLITPAAFSSAAIAARTSSGTRTFSSVA